MEESEEVRGHAVILGEELLWDAAQQRRGAEDHRVGAAGRARQGRADRPAVGARARQGLLLARQSHGQGRERAADGRELQDASG